MPGRVDDLLKSHGTNGKAKSPDERHTIMKNVVPPMCLIV